MFEFDKGPQPTITIHCQPQPELVCELMIHKCIANNLQNRIFCSTIPHIVTTDIFPTFSICHKAIDDFSHYNPTLKPKLMLYQRKKDKTAPMVKYANDRYFWGRPNNIDGIIANSNVANCELVLPDNVVKEQKVIKINVEYQYPLRKT